MLLGLIPERIKTGSEVLNLVSRVREGLGTSGSARGGGEGGWLVGRPHPGSPYAFQTKFGMLTTPPHPKVHDPSHKPPRIEERPTYPS